MHVTGTILMIAYNTYFNWNVFIWFRLYGDSHTPCDTRLIAPDTYFARYACFRLLVALLMLCIFNFKCKHTYNLSSYYSNELTLYVCIRTYVRMHVLLQN
jgi:hypothetical protein